MALQSSQRLPELLFYTKKSYRILQLQFYKGTHPSTSTRAHYTTVHPENSPSRIQFYMQKTKSSSSTTTTLQRAKRPSFQIPERNSTHRRQGDLLEIHPCVLQDIPGIQPQDLPKASSYYRHSSLSRHSRHSSLSRHSRHSRDIPDIPVIHDLPASPGNSTSSSISRDSNPFQHSPIRMHILHILQFLQFDWFPQKNSTEYQLSNYKLQTLQTLHSSKKGRCCDIGQTCIGKDVKMTYFLE